MSVSRQGRLRAWEDRHTRGPVSPSSCSSDLGRGTKQLSEAPEKRRAAGRQGRAAALKMPPASTKCVGFSSTIPCPDSAQPRIQSGHHPGQSAAGEALSSAFGAGRGSSDAQKEKGGIPAFFFSLFSCSPVPSNPGATAVYNPEGLKASAPLEDCDPEWEGTLAGFSPFCPPTAWLQMCVRLQEVWRIE